MQTIPNDIIKRLEKIRTIDIRFENLGADSNFIEADATKEEIVILVEEILKMFPTYSELFPMSIIQSFFTIMNAKLSELEDRCDKINQLIKKGIHNQDFPTKRREYLSEFARIRENSVRDLFSIKEKFILVTHNEILNSQDKLLEKISTINEKLKTSDEQLKKSSNILKNLRDLSMAKTLMESAGSFDLLRKNHWKYQTNWFIAFIISLIFTLTTIFFVLISDIKYLTISDTIILLFKKILFIGLPILLVRITLKKYNIERNLKIIYDHRATVLEQYTHFEDAIGDDKEAKNRFRLEVAKYIFSDPNTGYLEGHSSTSDLSVNPIINLAENFIRKSTA